MQEKEIFQSGVLPFSWIDFQPPLATQVTLRLHGVRDPGGARAVAGTPPCDSRCLTLGILLDDRRVDSESRAIKLGEFGISSTDDRATEAELEAILQIVTSIELRRTPDNDIRAEAFYTDGCSERFFFLEGANVFRAAESTESLAAEE